MVSVKFRRSAGSGKYVFIVGGRSSSVRSGTLTRSTRHPGQPLRVAGQTFLYTYLCGAGLWLLLCRRVLVLLHAKDLCDRSVTGPVYGSGTDLQHGELFAGRWWGEVEMWRHVPRGRTASCMAMSPIAQPIMSNLSETLPVIDLDLFLSDHDGSERVQQECRKVRTPSFASRRAKAHSAIRLPTL